jgi:hypothetical protein
MALMLGFQHPFHHYPHVREHAPSDVERFATLAGFVVEVFSTFFSFEPRPGVNRTAILGAISSLGYNPANRGDTAFFVFRKSSLPTQGAETLQAKEAHL